MSADEIYEKVLSKGIFEYGLGHGLKRGMEKGLKQGIQQGEQKKAIEAAKNALSIKPLATWSAIWKSSNDK